MCLRRPRGGFGPARRVLPASHVGLVNLVTRRSFATATIAWARCIVVGAREADKSDSRTRAAINVAGRVRANVVVAVPRLIRFMGSRRPASPANEEVRSPRSLGILVALCVVVLNLAVAGLVGAFLLDFESYVSGDASKDAENISKTLDAGLQGIFSQIDFALQTVADEYERELDAGGVDAAQLQATLERQSARLIQIDAIRISGANGDLRYSSLYDVVSPINNANREFFRKLRDNPNSGLVISKEFGSLHKNLTLFFARRLCGPDGAFQGDVHSALRVEKLTQMFSTLDVGPHGVVSLWSNDAALIARFPQVESRRSEQPFILGPANELVRLIKDGRDSGFYHQRGGVDGVTRLFATRKVGRFPLYLVVGLAHLDYEAEWRTVASHLAVVSGLFLIASVVGGLLIYARSATKAKAQVQSRLAASVYENSSEGMAIFDAQRSIVDVNRSFARLTGISADKAKGRKIDRWFLARRDAGLLAAAARSLRETGHWAGELWLKRREGEPFLARVSVSAVNGGARFVALFADATEQKRAQEMIWRHANFDTVTQLPNRRHFCDSLRREILKLEATKAQIAVIFIDLDRFKDVNDRFDHAVGDQLQHQAAERIRSCVRADDLVARLGGDEFTVMLRKIAEFAEVERLAERIAAALARPYEFDGEHTFNSASLGVTLCPRDGSDVETLLRNADQAMYAAKRAGRNCVRVFAPMLQVSTATHAAPVSDLHEALANNEIELHYQPIVEIGTGRVIKAEALARWRHPKHGDVPPSEFIPIAEETGLIVEIGDWVFRRAAAQAQRWRSAFDPQFQISINVSAVQLAASDGAAANFDRLVARPGLGPGAMIIEITESALIDCTEAVRNHFARYRKAGIELALDDFGTGYSSFAYLKDFDISYLKADRAFVSGLTERRRDYAVCEAMVAMAHKLAIRIIAEGVETEAQHDLLAAAGCDCAQGYLYSRPVPAADFQSMFFADGFRRALKIRA